jgi:hypothetical protein
MVASTAKQCLQKLSFGFYEIHDSIALLRDVQRSICPHPPTPSPRWGEGEQEWLKVPLPLWERDLG